MRREGCGDNQRKGRGKGGYHAPLGGGGQGGVGGRGWEGGEREEEEKNWEGEKKLDGDCDGEGVRKENGNGGSKMTAAQVRSCPTNQQST